MKSLFALAAAATVLLSIPHAEAKKSKEPLRLAPASKWLVDYENEGCRLLRRFGEGENQAIVSFNRYGPEEDFVLTLAGEPFRLDWGDGLAMQFGPNEAEQKVEFMVGDLGGTMPAVIMSSVRLAPLSTTEKSRKEKWKSGEENEIEPVGAEREKAVTYLYVNKPLKRPVVLELGSMGRPFSAMNTCVDDLMTNWGIDVEKHKNLKKSVVPLSDPGGWINTPDYPVKMLRQGQPALVEFRMDIDETGQVTACHIQQTSRPKEFDDAVCKSLMRRAKFRPAIDADGNPIRSFWNNTVRFQLSGM